MSTDYTVTNVTNVPSGSSISKKPTYLITLKDPQEKKGSVQYFITTDKPDSQNNFLLAKGIFSEHTEEYILKNYSDILTNAVRDRIVEMWFPVHRIICIKSLVFNANKFVTLSK